MTSLKSQLYISLVACIDMLWLLLCCVPHGAVAVAPGAVAVTPVVIVPGALGSHIEAKLSRESTAHWYCDKKADWYTLWLSIPMLLGPQLYCWADNFKMQFKDGIFSNTPGVETRAPGFGETHSIDYVDTTHLVSYMVNLVQGLMKIPGAKEGVTVRAAPYDFRYSPPSRETKDYFNRLQGLIEETYTLNNNSRVALVSHSLGSLISSTFLHTMSTEWKNKYLHSWSTLGGVLGGSMKVVKVLVSHGVLDGPDWLTNRLVHREVGRTIMGNYYMLPRSPIWGEDELLLQTPNRNYTMANLDQLFTDMGVESGVEMWNTVKNETYIGDPGVKTYCFNGRDIPTAKSFYYTDQSRFPDEIPQVVEGDGDGTVPRRSLKICHDWESTKEIYEYSGEDAGGHDKMLDNKELIARIVAIVSQASNEVF